MKKCTKCGKSNPKTLEFFYKDSQKKDGLSPRCILCITKYREDNRDKINISAKKWRKSNPDKLREIKRRSRKNNPEAYKKYNREYYLKNKEKIEARKKLYNKKNKIAINKTQREYEAARKVNDPLYRLKSRARKLIHKAISRKGFTKRSKCNKILGCSWNFFKNHLEGTFELNYGLGREYLDWSLVHIDHIVPLDCAKTEEDVIRLNHYKNLQILFIRDNLEKGNKTDWSL